MELTKLYWDQRKHPSRPPRLPEVSAFDRDLYFTQISHFAMIHTWAIDGPICWIVYLKQNGDFP